MTQEEAIALSNLGTKALKEEACHRTHWHSQIPQIIAATKEAQFSGYPVYDREILTPELLAKNEQITLIGNAAHPICPFKDQRANQALLDALGLERTIAKQCQPLSNWRSAKALQFLHADIALYEGDEPKGRCLKRKE